MIRIAASRLLNVLVRHLPAPSREWGNAMLRETDFVEDEWRALLWAFGSITTICRLSISWQLRLLSRKSRELFLAKDLVNRTLPLLSGIAVSAAFLSVCSAAFCGLMHASWFDPAQHKLADRLLIVVVPETVYLGSAVVFWRQRRALAIGILGSAALLMAHVIMHFALSA